MSADEIDYYDYLQSKKKDKTVNTSTDPDPTVDPTEPEPTVDPTEPEPDPTESEPEPAEPTSKAVHDKLNLNSDIANLQPDQKNQLKLASFGQKNLYLGDITSGYDEEGQPIIDQEKLLNIVREQGLDPEDFSLAKIGVQGEASFLGTNRGLPWPQNPDVAGGGDKLGRGEARDPEADERGVYGRSLVEPESEYYYAGSTKTANARRHDPDNPNADENGFVHYRAFEPEKPFEGDDRYELYGPLMGNVSVEEGGYGLDIPNYPSDNKYKEVLDSLDTEEVSKIGDIYRGDINYTYEGAKGTQLHYEDWLKNHILIYSSISDSDKAPTDPRVIHLPHLPELIMWRREDVPDELHYFIYEDPNMHFIATRGIDRYKKDGTYMGHAKRGRRKNAPFVHPPSNFKDARYRNINWNQDFKALEGGGVSKVKGSDGKVQYYEFDLDLYEINDLEQIYEIEMERRTYPDFPPLDNYEINTSFDVIGSIDEGDEIYLKNKEMNERKGGNLNLFIDDLA